ncbi:hypothetical protein ACHQM5_029634 [Ranunculus cassubicifolius]
MAAYTTLFSPTTPRTKLLCNSSSPSPLPRSSPVTTLSITNRTIRSFPSLRISTRVLTQEGTTQIELDTTTTGGGGGGDGNGNGGGGGGNGDGDDEGDYSNEEDSSNNKKKMSGSGMSMSQKLTLGYAALVGVGGVMGYVKSGSQKSLAAGGISSLLLYYVYTQLPVNPMLASSLGFVLSGALLGVMGSRFKRSGKVFPAGVVSVVSFIMTGGYLHGIMRGLH